MSNWDWTWQLAGAYSTMNYFMHWVYLQGMSTSSGPPFDESNMSNSQQLTDKGPTNYKPTKTLVICKHLVCKLLYI